MRHAKRDYLLGGVPLWQRNYREILRLAKLGYSQRSIAASAGCARSTVQRVLERAESNPHTLEELLALSDKGIQQALFPASSIPSTRKPPDYERVHRELAKNGVTLSLLWNEYCEEGGAPHQGSDPRDAFKPEGRTAILPGEHGASEVGDKYSLTRLESACGRALQYTATPNYKTIQMILKTGSDLSQRGTGNKRGVLCFHQGRGLLRRG